MKRGIMIVAVLGLLGGAGYGAYVWLSQNSEKEGDDIRTDQAERRDVESVVTATGEVLPLRNSIVKSEISGRITEIHIDEGDRVERDQLLLELDRKSLRAGVREAERNVEAERLRLEKARRDYTRQEGLYEKEFVGDQTYLDSKTDLELARLNLEIAEARLEEAEEDLAKSAILAPHEGIVTRLDVSEGEVVSGASSVSEGTELLTVAELDELYMEADINEVDVDKLEEGDPAVLTFDSIPGFEVEGELNSIALSARKEDNVRVFPIRVIFTAKDQRIRPGISATVEIPIARAEDAVSVLLSAVFNDPDSGEHVYVRKARGDWERREVEVGINNLQHAEIKSGLEAGEVVALNRPAQFRRER